MILPKPGFYVLQPSLFHHIDLYLTSTTDFHGHRLDLVISDYWYTQTATNISIHLTTSSLPVLPSHILRQTNIFLFKTFPSNFSKLHPFHLFKDISKKISPHQCFHLYWIFPNRTRTCFYFSMLKKTSILTHFPHKSLPNFFIPFAPNLLTRYSIICVSNSSLSTLF